MSFLVCYTVVPVNSRSAAINILQRQRNKGHKSSAIILADAATAIEPVKRGRVPNHAASSRIKVGSEVSVYPAPAPPAMSAANGDKWTPSPAATTDTPVSAISPNLTF